ncbi:hypothetical protein MIR68_002606 [Amoeboaphelidium protococcarum]|nr:hypothetical protein MIR68_002606 [Amoeboaphelidium protococcarum]
MTSLFGIIREETPKFSILKKAVGYEIREYEPQIRAEVEYDSKSLVSGQGFRSLAGFIFGDNVKKESISMTSPVITSQQATTQSDKGFNEKISMTAPVQTVKTDGDKVKMAFVLPSKYTDVSQLPTPKNDQVKLCQVPKQTFAVAQFSWSASDETVKSEEEKLRQSLSNDSDVSIPPNAHVLLARYNPPWTLAFLRTNEILLPVTFKSGSE